MNSKNDPPSYFDVQTGFTDAEFGEIERDLALMDEIEAFAQSLPRRTEGRSPTDREIREMAYEDFS